MITSTNNGNKLDLGRHCGVKTGQSVLVPGDYALLTFHTDRNVQRKGFLLSFSAIPEGKFNQKTDRLFRRKELSRKENPGGELPHKHTGGVYRTFKGFKCDFVTCCGVRPQSSTAGAFKVPFRVMSRKNMTRDIYDPYSEKLWPRFWKCCPGRYEEPLQ